MTLVLSLLVFFFGPYTPEIAIVTGWKMYISPLSKAPLLGIYAKIQGRNVKDTTRMGFLETDPATHSNDVFVISRRWWSTVSISTVRVPSLPRDTGGWPPHRKRGRISSLLDTCFLFCTWKFWTFWRFDICELKFGFGIFQKRSFFFCEKMSLVKLRRKRLLPEGSDAALKVTWIYQGKRWIFTLKKAVLS